MTRLMQSLARNRLESLHVDRRSLWPRSKSSSLLETYVDDTASSETDDESFSSSTAATSAEEEEQQLFWWHMLLSRIKGASRLENVVINDDIFASLPTSTSSSSNKNNSNEESSSSTLTRFDEFLHCLPHLPELRQLRIYLSDQCTVDYAVLRQVVADCPMLEQLFLCGSSSWEVESSSSSSSSTTSSSSSSFALTSRHQVDNLARAIRNHPSLTSVSLQECFVAPDLSLDPILCALASMPRLEMINLTLTAPHGRRRLGNSSVLRLFRDVATLQDVTLWSVGLDDDHMESLRAVLPLHPSLVFLSLRCNPHITSDGWQCLLDMVEENYVLKSVYTDEIVPPRRETLLQHYLYWNQEGRRGALLQSQDGDAWQDAVWQWRDDPTALYYLVRQGHARLLRYGPSSSRSKS